jgi:hypothetical protein
MDLLREFENKNPNWERNNVSGFLLYETVVPLLPHF